MSKDKNLKNKDTLHQSHIDHILTPVDAVVAKLPVETNLQLLPFNELTWENFERFCYRLAKFSDDVEHYDLYGRQGQAQAGLDIYLRREDGKYDAWQCKRYQEFNTTKIANAVSVFLKGEWVDKTHTFRLLTSARTDDVKIQDELETQANKLKQRGVVLELWGITQLSEEAKDKPGLVDDFFGRHWLERFSGKEAIERLITNSQVLGGDEVIELKIQLKEFYETYFQNLDQGLVGATSMQFNTDKTEPPSLINRFVVPDITYEEVYYSASPSVVNKQDDNESQQENQTIPESEQAYRSKLRETRAPIETWLNQSGNKVCFLGEAGSGKSTLLRCLALDILSGCNKFTSLSENWTHKIPIILPFSRWTKEVEANPSASLEDVLVNWLKCYLLPERLLTLISLALQDRRLLLLVDGLDEWSNDTAARTALNRLEVTVISQKTTTIMTGRPRGIDKLRGLGAAWKVSKLATLSDEQQRELIETWFQYSSPYRKNSTQASLSWYTKNFIQDLHDKTDIREIAAVPLLLTGLLVLHIRQSASLPRNRFQVYKSLTELLLELHPETRTSAAQDTQSRFQVLDDQELRQRALSYLAFQIRKQGADSGILKKDAERIIESFLKDPDVLELSVAEAKAGAKELLAVNAETSGIIIEKSPVEIGFVHAVFEEYLSALYLSELSTTMQQKSITEKASDPRWYNVILNLLHQLNRPSDVDDLISHLESLTVGAVGELQRNQLLAEVAFGDIRCSPKVANRIADMVFNKIDTGYWLKERQAFLKLAVLPVKSISLKEKQQSYFARWNPETQWSREHLYKAFAKWKASDDLLEALWRGLFDEEFSNRRAAASSLAIVYAGNVDVEKRLLFAVAKPYASNIIASLIFALSKGWENCASLPKIVEEVKVSEDCEISIEGIFASIKLGSQSLSDRDNLLYLCGAHSRLSTYNYRGELSDALVEGWPDDKVVFEACLKSQLKESKRSESVDRDVALEVLIKGYPKSGEVIDHLCNLLHEKMGYLEFDHMTDGWSLLKSVYQGNTQVAAAIDDFVSNSFDESYVDERRTSLACLVSKSPDALTNLVRLLKHKQSFSFWAIDAMLDGWGMENDAVADTLLKLVDEQEIEYLDSISYLLPKILKDDEEKCHSLLQKIAQQEYISRPDFFVSALGQLSNSNVDDYIDLLLSLTDNRSFRSPAINLIANFPLHGNVKELAKQLIGQHDSPIASIAMGYSEDEELRNKILEHATPLPPTLRKSLVLSAEKEINPTLGLFGLLSAYSSEHDVEIRAIAEGAYYSNLYRKGEITQEHKDTLLKELSITGQSLESIRQAGFAGMLEANCLDIFVNAKSNYPDDKPDPLAVPILGQHRKKSLFLTRKVIDNWDEIVEVCSHDVVKRLQDISFEHSETFPWHAVTPHLGESKTLKELFLSHCRSTEDKLESQELNALAQLQPSSQLLLRHCIKGLEVGEWHRNYSIVTARHSAGIILGQQFFDNKKIVTELVKLASEGNEGAIIALSLVDSEQEVLKSYCEKIFDGKKLGISYLAASYIICYCGNYDHFIRHIGRRIDLGDAGQWCFPHEWVQIVRHRLLENTECYLRLFDFLKRDDATPNERASIPQLLAQARGVSPELKAWCDHEIEKQNSRFIHEHGYNIVADRVQPVFHSLVELLS